ncbi:unnamed protein product, partial [Discosporangium mesarthrocarpum]
MSFYQSIDMREGQPIYGQIDESHPVVSFPEDGRRKSSDSTSYGATNHPTEEAELAVIARQEARPTSAATTLYKVVLGLVCISGLGALSGYTRKARSFVPLETDTTYPFTTAEHRLRPGPVWGHVKKPYPTGAWWLNLVVEDGDGPAAPLPYAVKATEAGVGMSYSSMRRSVTSKMVQDLYDADLTVTAAENQQAHYVMSYDNLTVTLRHDLFGGGNFHTMLARGSPYMTFDFMDATPHIQANGDILQINGESPNYKASYHGTTFKVMLSNWETWMIYTSGSVTWMLGSSGKSLEMVSQFTGMLRLAMLPHAWDKTAEDALTQHAYAFPRGGTVEINVEGDKMVMR